MTKLQVFQKIEKANPILIDKLHIEVNLSCFFRCNMCKIWELKDMPEDFLTADEYGVFY